jgi:hypothetical protein
MRWAIFVGTAISAALSCVPLAMSETAAAPSQPAKAHAASPPPSGESGEVVRETVTRFLWVKHQDGYVVTGIVAPDGQGDVILQTYCYFYQPTTERTGRVVDMVVDGVRLPNLTAEIVPMPEEAIKKCRSSGKAPAPSLGGASR